MKNYFGLITGIIFSGISVLLPLTFVGPLLILIISEGIGSYINSVLNINDVGASTFYLSISLIVIALLVHTVIVFKIKRNKKASLIIFFLVLFIFVNSAIFYWDFIQPNFHMDGQQAFGIIEIPYKTYYIYPILGLIHDLFTINRKNNNS